MQIKQEINVYQFRDMFRNMGRQDNFSYEGLGILFEHLESLSEDIGPIELDIIALCCEYNEMHWREVAREYSVDLDGCEDDEERIEAVREYLEDNTCVLGEWEDETPKGTTQETPKGTTFVFSVF